MRNHPILTPLYFFTETFADISPFCIWQRPALFLHFCLSFMLFVKERFHCIVRILAISLSRILSAVFQGDICNVSFL